MKSNSTPDIKTKALKEKKTKPYLAIFSHSRSLTCLANFNMNTRKWTYNPYHFEMDEWLPSYIEAIRLGNPSDFYALQSHFPDILKAEFKRNRDGEIILSELPNRLTLTEAIDLATQESARGSNPLSLENLTKGKLTDDNRYIPLIKITPEILAFARGLREAGVCWRDIGNHLDINHRSLSSAYSRIQKLQY